jgi:hypothetical protein
MNEELPRMEGYEPEKKVINMIGANVFGLIIMVVLALLLGVPFVWLHGGIDLAHAETMWLVVALVAGIVVHELIHGLAWMLAGRMSWRDISFGVMWRYLAPYCHCSRPMRKSPYVAGALAPLVVLGVVPCVVAFLNGSFAWLVFGIFLTVGACGDILVVWILRKEKKDVLIYDHPSEAGCYVYRPQSEPEPSAKQI